MFTYLYILFIKEKDMEEENTVMPTGPNTLETGTMIASTEKDLAGTPMEIGALYCCLTFLCASYFILSIVTQFCRYEGEWSNGRINGKGTLRLANGDVYSGEWKDAKRHGIGIYTYMYVH